MPISIEATLARLRNEFVTMLPARIDMLEQLLARIAHGEQGAGEMLEHAAHSLVGAAGVHRLMDISAAARKLETVAASLPAAGRVDEPRLFALHKALARLAAAADNPVHGFVPPPEARLPLLVAVVGADADRTLWLRTVLEDGGYRVAVIAHPADCAEACRDGDGPVALIVDLDPLGNDSAAAKPVADLKARRFPDVPLILLSSRHDIESRLAACRAGATHYLTTPVSRDALLRSLSGVEKLASIRPYRVLLVDDDPTQLAAQSRILREAGMEVRATGNPLEVPDLLDSFAAELLLLDMRMPHCSGPELAAVLRGDGRHDLIPVVYLADAPDAGTHYFALDQGAEYLLAKPVDAHQLVTVASRCAKRYRQTQEQVDILRTTLYERERQQHALDAHAIVSITDAAGNILYANDKFCEVSGYSRHELVGQNHRIVKSGMHPAGLYADLWQTIARGLIWHGELCNRRKDGSHYWVETTIVPFLDGEGRPYQYISVRTDITRVKEAEQRLARSQVYANIGTWDWNIETGDLYWSERIAPLFGHADGTLETTYENFLAAVHPDDRQKVADAVNACVEHGTEYDIEHRVLWPDGSVHWLLERGDVVRDATGIPLHMLGVVQDITERKLAQVALEASQRLARLGNWRVDLQTGRISWSREVFVLFDRDPDEYAPTLAAYYAELCHPDDVAKVKETERRLLEYGGPERVDHRILWPDGSVRWVHLEGYAKRDPAGTPVALAGMVQDITERKHTEMALEEIRKRLEEAQRLARLGHWELDIATGRKTWSREMYGLCNRTPETYTPTLENYYKVLIHPDDIPRAKAVEQRILESGEAQRFDHRILWPDGTVRWIHLEAYAVCDAEGQPVKMIGTAQDITERKLTEMALEESRARLEEAQSLARLGHWTADMTTGALQWSDEIYRIFGLDPATFTASVETFERAVHPDDWEIILASEKRAVETGVHDVVHRIVRPDGEVRYVHELAHARVGANGELLQLAGTVQDVTELKQAEHAMLQAKEAAEAASRAKSEFLASMSHELRTPLNSILGFAQLFAMDTGLPPRSKEYAREIERAGQHLLSLVNDLIDLARIEAGKLDLFLAPVSVQAVVADSLAMVAPIARDRGIQLIDAGGSGSGKNSMVVADSTRLQQVLINLLSNAIKYNRPHGTVHIACHAERGAARIAITDNGPGIPAEKQARMFSAFDRLGAERGQVEGSGIGLVITRRIVEAMGGSIGFESAEGQGSTFWVSLLVTAATANHASEPLPAETDATAAARAHVLYIEDNPMNLHLMQQVFAARQNLELRTAHTAEIGIQLARVEPPALILMDINLPGMDGYAALRVLKTDPATAGVPVVAVTANAMKGDEKRGLKAGFDAYLTKPIDIPALFRVVDKLALGAGRRMPPAMMPPIEPVDPASP
jgi:PAS domain S-box-containing protein